MGTGPLVSLVLKIHLCSKSWDHPGWFFCFVSFTLVVWDDRTLPASLPGWMVVCESTLGSKQGTLWKAPRNAERETKDSNVWTKNDFWTIIACKPSAPLAISDLSGFISVIFVGLRFSNMILSFSLRELRAKVTMWPLKVVHFCLMSKADLWPRPACNYHDSVFMCFTFFSFLDIQSSSQTICLKHRTKKRQPNGFPLQKPLSPCLKLASHESPLWKGRHCWYITLPSMMATSKRLGRK